jgi:hypothetical protein
MIEVMQWLFVGSSLIARRFPAKANSYTNTIPVLEVVRLHAGKTGSSQIVVPESQAYPLLVCSNPDTSWCRKGSERFRDEGIVKGGRTSSLGPRLHLEEVGCREEWRATTRGRGADVPDMLVGGVVCR